MRSRFRIAPFGAVASGLVVGVFVGSLLLAPAWATHCGAETINGTSGEDYVYSNDDRASNLNGLGSADYMEGYGCADTIHGGTGPDEIHGASGLDNLFGDDGHENTGHCSTFLTYCGTIFGGFDSDYIEGNNNNDTIDDTAGADVDFAYGNGDGDTVKVNDADTNDTASGGTGTDSCPADSAGEKDSSCES